MLNASTYGRIHSYVKVRIGFEIKDPRLALEMGAHVSFLEGD